MEIQAADTGRRDTARPEHRQAGEALYSTYFALGEARADEVDGGGGHVRVEGGVEGEGLGLPAVTQPRLRLALPAAPIRAGLVGRPACLQRGAVGGSVAPRGACRAGPCRAVRRGGQARPDRRADGPARSRACLLMCGACLFVFVFACVACLCLCLCVLCVWRVLCVLCVLYVYMCLCCGCYVCCMYICVCVVGGCCACVCMWSKRGPDPCSQTFTA